MKKLLLAFCILAAGLTALSANPAVAILDFESNSIITAQRAAVMTDLFRNELVRSERADIVDRKNIEHIKNELKFQNSDYADPARMKALGKMIGADLLFTGSFNYLGSQIFLIVTMTDVETARVTFSDRLNLNSWDEYDRRVKDFAAGFIARFPVPEVLAGTWTAAAEVNSIVYTYEINFTGKGRCLVKIDDGTASQDAPANYAYDGTLFKLNAFFRNAKIPGQKNIQWSSVLTFSDDKTAFNILVKPAPSAAPMRLTFTKSE
ncbi:MAG: penicillin-binding protein activator LpoB [Spirochaetota bacterium]|jgi:TolB-like protein|nr:penicillin-binding protein activator LpoB [Spirochaetota bacterium]